MSFKEYWESRSSIEYEEMVEAKAAFDFQESRIPKWINCDRRLPEPEEQVIAFRAATDDQLAYEKEYCPIIFAAIDPVNHSVWYDWETEKDIDESLFTITHWMPIESLGIPSK